VSPEREGTDPDRAAWAELFELAGRLPTYAVEKISKATNVRRLVRLGRALAYDKLHPKALDEARDLVIATLQSERKRKENDAAFAKAIKEHSRIDLRAVDVDYGVESEALNESFEAVQAVSQNIEDLYDQAGRKLGEGLNATWVKAQVAGGAKPAIAKLELNELLSDSKTVDKLENVAQNEFQGWSEHHKAAIAGLPEGRREIYRKLRRQAAKPEPEDLELPLVYEEPGGDYSFERHLYGNGTGEFSCKLNEWEKATVEAELADAKVLGWLRNVPRKSWAMKIPYKYDGEDAPMYPDFLFFRSQGDGVVVDILEPHHLGQDDSWAKAVGLADFAVRHGDRFGRIEMIIKEKDKLIRLDVNKEAIRDKVRKVSDNTRLRELFGSDGSTMGAPA